MKLCAYALHDQKHSSKHGSGETGRVPPSQQWFSAVPVHLCI